jgi:predicted RecB family nuclease
MNNNLVVTPSHFFKLAKSPMWIWHDAFGDPSKKEPLSEFTLKIMEDGNLHEKEYISKLEVEEVDELNPIKGVQETLRLMKEGKPLIYQGWLQMNAGGVVYRGRPDLLEKRPGSSIFGEWIYVPVDIKSSSEAKTLHKQQLAFYCMILSSVQGASPASAVIINRAFIRLEVAMDQKILDKTQEDIDEVLEILRGKRPDLHISSSTKDTPWYRVCLQEAEDRSDISLIYKLRKDTAQALREHGIDTLSKMAVQDVDALPKLSGASKETLQKAKLQAQSLIEKRPIFIGEPEPVEETDLKLYFDIEGDPWLNAEYLFGFWVVGDPEGRFAEGGHVRFSEQDPGKYFIYFLAESPDLEMIMWDDFLEWLCRLPYEYKVYHYAHYEQTAINKLGEKYKRSQKLDRFQGNLIDLKKNVDNAVIFPLYFYSIKDIAKSSFVNFKWRHAKAGGGQSIFWYESWLETQDRQILQDIIDYNEDDVRATEHLHLWINKASQESLLEVSMTSNH